MRKSRKQKNCHCESSKITDNPDDWMKNASEHPGSWWPHWQKWIGKFGGEKVAARKIKNGIEPAPGSYVKVQC